MSAESHKTRQRLQDRRAHLSGAEFKIASYLQEQLEKADGQSILLDDERLAAATGVSLRQAGVVRKSLVNQGLVQAETVRGRGTIYRFPGSDTAPPAAVIPSKPVETPVSAAVPEPHSATSAGTMNDAEVLVAEMLEGQVRSYLPKLSDSAAPPTAVITSQPIETPVSATVPEPHSVTSAGTVNEQTAVLVAVMMERQMPDGSYLQKLQELAGSPDLLLECLRWMVDQVDSQLGIPKYRYQADGHDLLAAGIGSLCRSPQSPFLAGRRAKA